jgi:hypothetical protein
MLDDVNAPARPWVPFSRDGLASVIAYAIGNRDEMTATRHIAGVATNSRAYVHRVWLRSETLTRLTVRTDR